ncbi:carbohydrate porin [Hydrogenobaculum sp.]
MKKSLLIASAFSSAFSSVAMADTLPPWFPQFLGAKATLVGQYSTNFNSPYSGPMTFGNPYKNNGGGRSEELTQFYGIYTGAQLTKDIQAYLDIQLFKGNAIGNGQGIGGYPGLPDLGKNPFIARAYLIYTKALSNNLEYRQKAPDQLSGYYPEEYFYIKIGKFSIADDFDNNQYANSPRKQFLNYDFNYNVAWDYGADTRGYTVGVESGVVKKRYSFKVVIGAEHTDPDSNTYDESGAYSLNAQLSLRPNDIGTVIRLLGMLNYGRMGSYEEAIDNFSYYYSPNSPCYYTEFEQSGYDYPVICTESKSHKRYKWGFFINLEQPIADDGKTGLFLRAGFNNGQTEDFAYTDADRDIAGGISINGIHWKRPQDQVGIGLAINGLSNTHKRYLESGTINEPSSSFFVGSGQDGQFNYGYEEIMEAYYKYQLNNYISISPDAQYIRHPGYDKNRGPLWVYGLRVNAEF